MMNWLKKLRERFRRPPRLVMEFRWDENIRGTRVRLMAVNTDTAKEYERKMMAVVLLALENGAFRLSREKDFGCMGMEKLWKNALALGCVLARKWMMRNEEKEN